MAHFLQKGFITLNAGRVPGRRRQHLPLLLDDPIVKAARRPAEVQHPKLQEGLHRTGLTFEKSFHIFQLPNPTLVLLIP